MKIRELDAAAVTDAVRQLCLQANRTLPPDVKAAMDAARAAEPWPLAQETLGLLAQNLDAAAQNGTKDDPQVHRGAPAGTGQSTVDGTKAGDIQQLDQENTPGFHGNVVHTIGVGYRRGGPVVNPEDLLHQLAVGEEAHDQQNQANKKCNHTGTSSNCLRAEPRALCRRSKA